MSQLSQFNDASIVTWNGIITMYSIIRYFAVNDRILPATEEETKRYKERR